MRTFTLLLMLALYGLAGSAQNIAVTFTGTVPAVRIDSVTATNLATDESITLPGDATLLLSPKTGVVYNPLDQGFSQVYPNPFPGRASILARVTEPQDVNMTIHDLTGKIVARTRAFVQPGDNSFSLTLSTPGIYLAILETSEGTAAHKLICTSSSGSTNQMQHSGSNLQPATSNQQQGSLKALSTTYTLGYSAGETIQYRCCSGEFRSVFTGSPMEPVQYEVTFPPIAALTIDPVEGNAETRFTLDASACTDAETPSDDLEVRWDLDGDGSWDTEFDQSKIMICQFPDPGPRTIMLEVKDPDGLTDSESKEISIAYPSFTDSRDGHVYHYKKIGDQYWMIENLAYLPAVSIPIVGSQTAKHYYVYGFESTSVIGAKATDNYSTYGVLYNWPASLDACPSGWHLPSDEEFKELELYLGMSSNDVNLFNTMRNSGSVGGKLKEAGTAHWKRPNTGATNSSGFTALGAGMRDYNGGFAYLNSFTYFWSSTDNLNTAEDGYYRAMANYSDGIFRYAIFYRYGLSVRCIKD